eukprot:2403106-Pleurochrysis_carterae.AAC.1
MSLLANVGGSTRRPFAWYDTAEPPCTIHEIRRTERCLQKEQKGLGDAHRSWRKSSELEKVEYAGKSRVRLRTPRKQAESQQNFVKPEVRREPNTTERTIGGDGRALEARV